MISNELINPCHKIYNVAYYTSISLTIAVNFFSISQTIYINQEFKIEKIY